MIVVSPEVDRKVYAIGVKFTKRNAGGWLVIRHDTGHQLGWLYKGNGEQWTAYCGSDPYIPHGIEDILDRLKAADQVDDYRTRRNTGTATYRPVGYGKTREEAVRELVWHLANTRALAVQAPDPAAIAAELADERETLALFQQAGSYPSVIRSTQERIDRYEAMLAEATTAV